MANKAATAQTRICKLLCCRWWVRRQVVSVCSRTRYTALVADACPVPLPAASTAVANVVRHTAIVRATHWLTTLCFLALLVTGAEITISHPRFYWGETGNVHTPYLFKLPIPASRRSVPTGYGYVLHDQNGWSRSLHFEMAWLVVATGLLYLTTGLLTGHFRRNFVRSY